jgi:tetratricopeptide (TPR) repeat protein
MAGKAEVLLETGRYEECLDLLNASIASNSNSSELYMMRSRLRFEMFHFDYALSDVEQAISLNEDEVAPLYYHRGRVKRALGENIEAMRDFNRAIIINRNLRDAYMERGVLRKEFSDYSGAVDDYSRALQMNRQDAEAYFQRGLARFMNSEYNKSLEDFSAALQLNPTHWHAMSYRGLAYIKLGKITEGCIDLQRAAGQGIREYSTIITEQCQ